MNTPMTPELYQRLKPLYDAALDKPKEQRAAYVAEACAEDAELQQHLQTLLAAHEDGTGPIDAPLMDLRGLYPGQQRTLPDGDLLLSRFRIVRLIGWGGMGEVYEAEDLFLPGVNVALKTILPGAAGDPDLQKRFEREVLLAREVTHPNLCPIHTIFHCEDPPPGYLFLTMKLLPGQTLSARLHTPPALTNEEGLAILRQASLGLAAIHAAGIIHRDIKPNNIMVDGSGPGLRLWITDFGLARAFDTETTLSTIGKVAGTPGYIAPELYLSHPPSQASDLFALGVVLHEVFTGQKPTPIAGTHSYAASPRLTASKAPALGIRLITECLQDDPQRRCTAFAEALQIIDPKLDRTLYIGGGHFWTRRRFTATAAASICAVAGGAWWKWDDVEDMLHPLPQKRFVALLNWPKTSDGQVIPMLNGVLTAIKSELARVEAFDRDFFVISPEDVPHDVAGAPHLKEICDPLGANLVLAASVSPRLEHFQLLLRVLDPISGRPLREKTLTSTQDGITSLPGKAVRAAASLLSVNHYLQSNARTEPGTQSTEAFTAFQAAETLMKQPNDSGLDAGIEKYKQAVELDPHYAVAYAKLSEAYSRLYENRRDPGALDVARGNCDRALTLSPDLVEGYLARAVVMQQRGDEQGALDQYAKALQLDPSNPKTLLWRANLYSHLNRWADAEGAYHRVLKERPNSWVTYNNLGDALDLQGKFRESLQAYRDATVLAPGNALAWCNLGGEYLQIGDFANATESLKKSLALDPNLAWAASYASLALRYQGRYEEALPFAIKSTEANPADDTNWLELGDCYSSLPNREGDAKRAYTRAAEEAKRHLQTNAASGPSWMLLALYEVKSGQSQNAFSLIGKAESLGANDLASQLYKARTLELLGRREDSLATLAACFRRGATGLQVAPFPDMQSLRKDPRYRDMVQSKLSTAEAGPLPGAGSS